MHTDLIFVQICIIWVLSHISGIKSLAYDNILTQLNTEASVHMYNISRNVRSLIFVETAKKLDCCGKVLAHLLISHTVPVAYTVFVNLQIHWAPLSVLAQGAF